MSTTYCAERCPRCDTNNLVDLGDQSDMTAADTEGFKCFKCGAFVRLPEADGEKCTLTDDGDCYDEGKPVP